MIKVAKDYFKLALKRDSILAMALSKTGKAQKEEITKLHDQLVISFLASRLTLS